MKQSLLLSILFLIPYNCIAQDSLMLKIHQASSEITNKVKKEDVRLLADSKKFLQKELVVELRMRRKVAKVNPQEAKTLFDTHIASIQNRIKQVDAFIPGQGSKTLIPYMDTLITSSKFLKNINGNFKGIESIDAFSSHLNQGNDLQQMVVNRVAYLKKFLPQYPKLLGGYNKLNNSILVYNEVLNNYKGIFTDKNKLVKVLLDNLHHVPGYQKFKDEFSYLSQLFNFHNGNQIKDGQQGKDTVLAALNRCKGKSAEAQEATSKLLQDGKEYINGIKAKALNCNTSQVIDKSPNVMTTKSLWNRLEYGTFVQSTNSSYYIPKTVSLSIQLIYKVDEKRNVGIGGAYHFGVNTNSSHFSISHEGIGFNVFGDWKLLKSFYAKCYIEDTYRTSFRNLRDLEKYQHWKIDGYLGLSKKYSIRDKVKGEVQVLWNVLRTPAQNPLSIRFGRTFSK